MVVTLAKCVRYDPKSRTKFVDISTSSSFPKDRLTVFVDRCVDHRRHRIPKHLSFAPKNFYMATTIRQPTVVMLMSL